MSNTISDNLAAILHAVYGEEVRQAIHDAIRDCYDNGGSISITNIRVEEVDEDNT